MTFSSRVCCNNTRYFQIKTVVVSKQETAAWDSASTLPSVKPLNMTAIVQGMDHLPVHRSDCQETTDQNGVLNFPSVKPLNIFLFSGFKIFFEACVATTPNMFDKIIFKTVKAGRGDCQVTNHWSEIVFERETAELIEENRVIFYPYLFSLPYPKVIFVAKPNKTINTTLSHRKIKKKLNRRKCKDVKFNVSMIWRL